MAEEAINEVLDWRKFVSMYAKKHNVTYAQSMKECSGPEGVWATYKKEHNIIKSRGKVDKVPKEEPQEEEVKKEETKPVAKKSKSATKKNKKPEKMVRIKAPPKGKKMRIRYVDDDSDGEHEIEIVNDNIEWGEDSDSDD